MRRFLLMLLALLSMAVWAAAEQPESGGLVRLPLPALEAPQESAEPPDPTVLDLGDRRLSSLNDLCAYLTGHPEVTRVNMFSTVLETKQLDELTAYFPNVRFGCTIHLVAGHYVRTDATAFSTLHGECKHHSTEQLRGLAYCTELQALDLGHNYLKDLSFLRNMPHLKVLILAVNETLSDISVLAELKELEYLELFTCAIRDITPLLELDHLLDLNLSYNTNLRDRDAVLSLPKSIERLWLSNIGITFYSEKHYQELMDAYPDATISLTDHPTGNGWREHPRYDTIYRIFNTGVYEPFAP